MLVFKRARQLQYPAFLKSTFNSIRRRVSPFNSPSKPLPSWLATTVASLTLLATVPRTLPSSRTSSPPMVQPPGVLTFSLTKAGCSPLSTIPAVPLMVCAAISCASARGNPIATAPSARDSIISARNAGPDPHNAVDTSIILAGKCTTRPICLKIPINNTVENAMEAGCGYSDDGHAPPGRSPPCWGITRTTLQRLLVESPERIEHVLDLLDRHAGADRDQQLALQCFLTPASDKISATM